MIPSDNEWLSNNMSNVIIKVTDYLVDLIIPILRLSNRWQFLRIYYIFTGVVVSAYGFLCFITKNTFFHLVLITTGLLFFLSAHRILQSSGRIGFDLGLWNSVALTVVAGLRFLESYAASEERLHEMSDPFFKGFHPVIKFTDILWIPTVVLIISLISIVLTIAFKPPNESSGEA
jgi:hypothetical protein